MRKYSKRERKDIFKMSKEVLRKKWGKHVGEYKRRSQSINSYCRENNLKASTFRYWLDKDKTKKATDSDESVQKWLPVTIENSVNRNDSREKISIKIGTAVIEIDGGFNKEVFQEIVNVLVLSC
jgi:hypothetical protein